jgi:hypothetical protein
MGPEAVRLLSHLGKPEPNDDTEQRRLSSRICRLLQIFRSHRLVAKISRSRRYRVNGEG